MLPSRMNEWTVRVVLDRKVEEFVPETGHKKV